MGRIKSFAAMHGMSAEAVGLEQARISQGMGGGVYGATSSEIIQRSAQIAYDNGRKGGSPRTRDEVVGFGMAGVSSINTEAAADAQLVATDLIMKDTSLTAAQRKELKAGISGITNAGANMEARGVATAALREKIAAMKGRSMEDLMEATPISPPTGPATGSSNGLHPKSNFLALTLSVLAFLMGFAMSVIDGMLYKIMPFLVWFHLFRGGMKTGVPNMKQIIPESWMWWHYRLQLGTLASAACALFWSVALWVVILGLLLQGLLLGRAVFTAVTVYRNNFMRINASSISAE